MLTTELLSQPDVLGQVVADGQPIATIGDIGPAQPGKEIAFDAAASFDPSGNGPLTYAWSFGDGATASGISVSHVYSVPGVYTLRLTVSAPAGARRIAKTIVVTAAPPVIVPPFSFGLLSGRPQPNPKIAIPTPNSSLPGATTTSGAATTPGGLSPTLLVGVTLIVLALLIAGGVLMVVRRRARVWREAASAVPDVGRPGRVAALETLAREQLQDVRARSSPSPPPPTPPAAHRVSGGHRNRHQTGAH
jgi:hypothetical protein